jgi:hypothetical protein
LEGAYVASMSSSSSGRSSRDMVSGKEAAKAEQDEPVRVANAEEEAMAKAVEAGDETKVEAAMAAPRQATREGARCTVRSCSRRSSVCCCLHALALLAGCRRGAPATAAGQERLQERSAGRGRGGRRGAHAAGEERRSRQRRGAPARGAVDRGRAQVRNANGFWLLGWSCNRFWVPIFCSLACKWKK